MVERLISEIERHDSAKKPTSNNLPTFGSYTLHDMRLLNHHDTGASNDLLDFGTLELTGSNTPSNQPADLTGTDTPSSDAPSNQLPGEAPVASQVPPKPDLRDPEVIEAERNARPLADSFGLHVNAALNENGDVEFTYFLPADGSQPRQEILRTTETSESTVEQELNSARKAMLMDIQETYNVSVNRGRAERTFGDVTLTTHEPSIEELSNLDIALEHGQPSQLNTDGTIMDVNFFDSPPEGIDFNAVGRYLDNSINLFGLTTENSRAQKIIEHELAHHAQDVLRQQPGGQSAIDNHYAQLGWTRNDEGDYLVQRNDGALFLPESNDSFVRTDVHGRFLDANGIVVNTRAEAEALTNEQMFASARVPHVHDPMPTRPSEHDAEGQAFFRHSREFRTVLYQASPEFYAAERQLDQEMINRSYGTNHGVSLYIRNPDGLIVPNIPENRAELEQFEQGMASAPQVGTKPTL